MMKFLLVLLSCSVVLGLERLSPPWVPPPAPASRQPPRQPQPPPRQPPPRQPPPPQCRLSEASQRAEVNVQSIPWEDEGTNVLLQDDDTGESSVSEDPAGTRDELTVPARADFARVDFRPLNYYYHQNPCCTTVVYERLTSAATVSGRKVTVLFPDKFQQINCRYDRCPKCPGKCVQKYKYETALVRDRCEVRWDRVRVPSGCCCHHYLPYYYFA